MLLLRLIALWLVPIHATSKSFLGKYHYYEDNTLYEEEIGKFGVATALSKDGKILVVGADALDAYRGGVYAYRRRKPGADWVPIGDLIEPTEALSNLDMFGAQLALTADGKLLAVSAQHYLNFRGAVWIFKYNKKEDEYVQIAGPIMADDTAGDDFGTSVALTDSGKELVVGAIGYRGQDGGVFIYKYSPHTKDYELVQKPLSPSKLEGLQGNFGFSVAISGDGKTLVASAPYYPGDLLGAVFIYRLNSKTKQYELVDEIDGKDDADYVGQSLSISKDGKMLAVGGNYGKVRMYALNGKTGKSALISMIDSGNEDYQTYVALSNNGKVLVIGSFTIGTFDGYCSVYAWDKTEKDYVMVSGPFEDPAGPEDSLYGTSVAIDGAGKTWASGASGTSDGVGAVYTYSK